MTCGWTIGLLRRAVLDTGRRAVADGRLREVDHVLELSLDEVVGLAAGQAGPGAVAAAARADERAMLSSLVPPASIGPSPAPPPLHLFPKAVATVTDMALTCIELLEKTPASTPSAPHTGLGVGTERYRGRARVARTPEEALAAMEPGDVLVVPFTTPAYNTVLSIAGGLVTEEGGALSHAAVLARELGVPAVIGVAGALTVIPDGAQVTVNPTTGEVTLG
jgi:pyruvate,water dikinase